MKKWPLVLALILTYVIFAILLNSVGTVILQVIHHYNVTKHSASTLEGFKDLPIAIVSFFVASFLPRLGYKLSLQLGLIVVTLACFAMPLLPGFLTTKCLFLALGASFALVKVSVYATIGTITDSPRQHASLLNTIEGFFMLGVLVGNWLFSLFIHDSTIKTHEWLNVYWVMGSLCLINLFILRFTLIPKIESPSKATFWQDFNDMLKLSYQSFVLIFIVSTFMYVLIEQSISTWLPTFNHEILRIPRSMSVQVAGLMAGSLALGRLLAGVLLKRMAWHTLLSICIIGMATLLIVILPVTKGIRPPTPVNWQNAPLAIYLLPIIGIFMAPIYPAINSVMLSSLPKSQHAAMTGLIVIFSALGGTTGSIITGNLFSSFGGQKAFYLLLLPLAILYFSTQSFRSATKHSPALI
ncbi:MFS transporter [Legionella impletisoli]|uniref:MFS transporter n=1 Tax=Legionella impletisoli TaxID=343510 RepID=A0A917N9M4_9GAMM|nr:MFS transporter [Legionella impletisoli]GGI75475.1 MFS transporter [Legionella impletisoli]